MTDEQPKPLGADENPVERGLQLANLVASDQPGESAGAMRMLGMHAARHGFSKRLSEMLAGEIPYLMQGGAKTRAELERELGEAERKYAEALDANAEYVAQNEAIREENERLRKPGVKERVGGAFRRLRDAFTPAAADGTTPKTGFLSSLFIAASSGVAAYVAMKAGVPPVAVYILCGTGGGLGFFAAVGTVGNGDPRNIVATRTAPFAAGVCGVLSGAAWVSDPRPEIAPASFFLSILMSGMAGFASNANSALNPYKVFAGALAGMALSAALVFSAASGPSPDELTAATRAASDITIGQVMVEDGTVYAGISPSTGRPFYTTPKDPSMVVTWPKANEYCEKLVAHGHDDWRLPVGKKRLFGTDGNNELELMFLRQSRIGGFDPRKDGGEESVFYYTLPSVFFAKNRDGDDRAKVMARDFTHPDGALSLTMKNKASFRCVRG